MKNYWSTILVVILALIQIPGVLNGSNLSLFALCFCFLIAVFSGILNGQTHEIKKQLRSYR